MNRRQKIIVSVTGIFLVLLILLGLTYAYFLTRINGNKNNTSISVTTANLAVSWINGTTNKIQSTEAIMPGNFTQTMDFKVENTGNSEAEYEVILRDFRVKWASTIENTIQEEGVDTYLVNPEDMELTITCESNIDDKTCSGKVGSLPTTNDVLVSNSIEEDEIQTYTVTLNYVDDGTNQSDDMNKSIEGLIDIRDPRESVDIEGQVANYTPGDIVQSNSTERISSIDKNGYYKILGLEFDNHTISVRNKTSVLTSKSISIEKGQSSNISGSNITTTDEKRVINIDADRNGSISIESTKPGNKYTEGTLALNFKSGNKIDFTTNKPVEDVDIKTNAISYPFTVKNIGETHQNITIKLTDIEIDESLKHVDFRWGLYNAKTGNGLSFGIFKYSETEELIYTDTIIDAGEIESNDYILRIWLHNNGTPQTELLNKKFKANISVTGEAIEYTDLSDSKCFKIEDNSIVKYGYLYPLDPYYYVNDECPTDIVIPRTITSIARDAFEIGDSVGEPQNYINELIIPDSVKEIGINIFGFWSIPPNHITIPENVELILGEAGTMGELSILFISDNTVVEPYALCANTSSFTFTTNFPPNECVKANDIVIMDGVTSIDEHAFASNEFDSVLEIPSSVEYIKEYAFVEATIDEIIIRGKTKLEDFEDYKGLTTKGYLPEGVKLTFRP